MAKIMAKIWMYKKVNIYPTDFNSSGIRWIASVNCLKLRTDTKSGMKELINLKLKEIGVY